MKAHWLLLLFVVLLAPVKMYAQIYRLGEMNTEQVRALDREKTAILIPGGILEEQCVQVACKRTFPTLRGA